MTELEHIAHYEIVQKLGQGGFATVYRARDTRMGREVALKIMSGNFAREPEFIQRFRREVQVAANLSHPHIVTIHDFGDEDGRLYLVMKLVHGQTLRQWLDAQKRLTLGESLPILAQLAEALDYLAGQGLVHRDVKPANVMIEREGGDPWVTLTDFGLVRSLESSTQLTEGDRLIGTLDYMAPEQIAPDKWGKVTQLTDVYALGVMTYEMLAGRRPFVGERIALLAAQSGEMPAPSPLEFASDLGADLADVLKRAVAKPAAERYPSATALVTALRQVVETRARQEKQQAELAQLLEQAQAARQEGRWLDVQSLCVQVMQLDRMHPDALTMMMEATTGLQRESADEIARRKRARRYEEGEQALAAGQWQAAIEAFQQVYDGNPDFREVQAKLAQARDELDCSRQYDEAIAHGENKRWAEACRLWVQVLRREMGYHGGDAALRLLDATDGLLRQFDHQQQDLDRFRGLVALYDTLAAAVEVQNWEYAATLGEQMLKVAPDLKCPPEWLARAQRALEAKPTLGKDRMVWKQDGKEMVRVPAGEFLYGDKKEKVNLPEFWIDKTPVTNAEYVHFVTETKREPLQHWKGKTPPKNIADHPVTYVSWQDAVAYAEWAGKRLPTEQEWEKAARGTDGREYPWGKWENGCCNSSEAGVGGTTPVGKYSPQGDSPYGCVDMAGNVWEWTASDHESGGKVLRGGSWNSSQDDARAAFRGGSNPDVRRNDFGFRCVVLASGG